MTKYLALAVGLFTGTLFPASVLAQFMSGEQSCPDPILSQLESHEIAPGETVESIAEQYDLLPETIVRLNPSLQQETVPVGTEILIPPFNGVRIEVPPDTTWEDLEQAYGVRADVLFELNGCTDQPQVVFLPGVTWEDQEEDVYTYTGLSHYPLPESVPVGQNYGWYTDPETEQRRLHSGVNLMADVGTSVLAAEEGKVTFAGEHPRYGNLVIILHNEKQTRYAHLESITVEKDQSVTAGEEIGTVGTSGQPNEDDSHLHFQVRYQTPQGWVAQDPAIHLSELD
ncbi:MAG: LysM peptidoglycan-binding domain-containing M23 family metallopeptidase [Halothece sp.]